MSDHPLHLPETVFQWAMLKRESYRSNADIVIVVDCCAAKWRSPPICIIAMDAAGSAAALCFSYSVWTQSRVGPFCSDCCVRLLGDGLHSNMSFSRRIPGKWIIWIRLVENGFILSLASLGLLCTPWGNVVFILFENFRADGGCELMNCVALLVNSYL